MKLIFAIGAALLFSFQASASDTLSTKIKRATVFLSGAQVFRQSKTITVPKGVNEFIIKDVSPYVNQNQLQATALGSFLILDVQFINEYVPPGTVKPTIVPERVQKEIEALNDSLLFISFEVERINAKLQNLNEEKRMVTQNQLIKSGGISDTLPEFKEIVEFYRIKLDEINELIHKWKKIQFYTSDREKKHRARLSELQAYSRNTNQPTRPAQTRYHILVTTYSDVATSGKLEANYFVANAGWIPAYDLRADNTTSPMIITYKARVYQNTGEDWDKVNLVLSTYDRSYTPLKPSAGIWRLDYVVNKSQIGLTNGIKDQNQIYYSQNFSSPQAMSDFVENESKNNPQFEAKERSQMSYQKLSAIQQNFTNVEFDVKLPYSIKADGSQKLMVVMNEEVEAEYYHYMLPRADKYAFLQAKIGDWENLSLLPGDANIYFNKTIVGSVRLDPAAMSDTMELTLGRDRNIVAKRKKIDDQEVKTKALGKRIEKTMSFEIELRNNSRGSIDLTLEDLIPVTNNEEIEIKLVKGDGAHLDEVSGKLTWNLTMKPGEKRRVVFTYSVEHDKDKPIS